MDIVLLGSRESKDWRVELVADEARQVSALKLCYGDVEPVLCRLATPLEIPEALLDAQGQRLKTLPDLRADAAAALDGMQQALEERWRRLLDQLSSVTLVAGADGTWMGAKLFAEGTQVAARAQFNFATCLSSRGGFAEFEGAVVVSGTLQATHGGAQVTMQLAWRLQVAAYAEAQLALDLPDLGLYMKPLAFPTLDWSGWSPGTIDCDWRLPSLPGVPLKASATQAQLTVNFRGVDKALDVRLVVTGLRIEAFEATEDVGDLTLELEDGVLQLSAFTSKVVTLLGSNNFSRDLPAPLDGLKLSLKGDPWLELQLSLASGRLTLNGCAAFELWLQPVANPGKRLGLGVRLPFRNGELVDQVQLNQLYTRSIEVIEPDLAGLAKLLFEQLPGSGSLAFSLNLPAVDLPDGSALIDVLGAILAAVGKGVAGLARIVQSMLETLLDLLRRAAVLLDAVEVLVILDARSGQLQQLVLQLRRVPGQGPLARQVAGLDLDLKAEAVLALLVDLRDGARDAYFVATLEAAQARPSELLTIATDLWFSSEQLERPTGDASLNPGESAPQRLLKLQFKGKDKRVSLVPLGVRKGQAVFLQALDTPLPTLHSTLLGFDSYALVPVEDQAEVLLDLSGAAGIGKRILPFLASGESGQRTSSRFAQYLEIQALQSEGGLKEGHFSATADVLLKLPVGELRSALQLQIDARRLTASLRGGRMRVDLAGDTPFELLGMSLTFVDAKGVKRNGSLILDFDSSDPRLYLPDDLDAVLTFGMLDLSLQIEQFVVHGGGLDLEASLMRRTTLTLPGLGTDFTFETASLKVRNGRAETFRLNATGTLPPALLGKVDVSLQLDFGLQDQQGKKRFVLLDGRLELMSKQALIRSEQTHFEFRLESLGVRAFAEGEELHFCAFITGAAAFKPNIAELADGMLAKLAGVELRFSDCPISGGSEVVRRALETLNLSFVVALDQPARASLFDTFFFEVRSIGFEPTCALFDDRPFALVIGGQVSFADTGDVIRAECDFHKLYLAPGLDSLLPRIRCEGLGLALRLGSALEIEGKVVAVDGRMSDSVLLSRRPPDSLERNGFMGQGRVAIQGLPAIAASFGFMEVSDPASGETVKAWFVYLEAQRISYQFQLGPVPLYLREAGLGLGYRFTYVGIEAIDQAQSLPEIIPQLDQIARKGLQPAKLDTWVQSQRRDLTLVARVMLSMSSASGPQEPLVWRDDAEKLLPNVLLLNAVVAMRRSTFMMSANAWLGYNYQDWNLGRTLAGNQLADKQAMTGYVVLDGARSEFLARLVSNPGAEVGPRLDLPEPFKQALREVSYEATLYLRPGLLHFELGWPNRIRWSKNIAGVDISVAGGAIFRVHDGALLVGMNLEGQLRFALSGRLDAGVVGIAVEASVQAALTARIIGYLDGQRVGNSLYYSLFALQVNVRFEVSAWLEIDAWLCKITLRMSFAFSLQVDVMSELAIQGDGSMGARVRATIAVSVFGRSLGLSVGLSMNPGLVDRAQARVGRFMNLGLVQDTPSAVAGIDQQDRTNATSAQIGKARREAGERSASVNRAGSGLARVLHAEAVPAGFEKTTAKLGLTILSSDFVMVLSYPKVMPAGIDPAALGDEQWLYLTFLPKESADDSRSGFYAAPRVKGGVALSWDHRITFSHLPDELLARACYVFADGGWVKRGLDQPLATTVNWDTKLRYSHSTEDSPQGVPADKAGDATLTELFFAAFRTPAPRAAEVNAADPDSLYREPRRKPDLAPASVLPEHEQARHDEQELGYLEALNQDPADRRCHEARDFLLHKFASDLFELTEQGTVPEDSVHVAHLGLTLLVPASLVRALEAQAPPTVVVEKRIDDAPSGYKASRDCTVFNRSDLRFSQQPPRFVDTAISLRDGCARLCWTLQWDNAAEVDGYVKHYRIVRTVSLDNDEWVAAPLTVTCAVLERYEEGRRVHCHSPVRFTDDFADLAPARRQALFLPGNGAVVRYAVTPVCISDTDGLVCSDFVGLPLGDYPLPRLKQGTATLSVEPREQKDPGKQLCRLDIAWEVEEGTSWQDPKGLQLFWRVVARGEPILPAGQYGSDAQSRRSLASVLGSSAKTLPRDRCFDMPYDAVVSRVSGFEALLRDLDDPQAWTLFAQPVLRRLDKNDRWEDVQCGHLTTLKLGVKILGKHAPTLIQVTALEYVRLPFASDLQAGVMAPVAAEDLRVLPGRAVQPEPLPQAQDTPQAQLVEHPEYAALSSLCWNLRPAAAAQTARLRLRSGFALYALNLDDGLDPTAPASWRQARRCGEVRLLRDEQAALVPGEVGETRNWKMRYPRQAAQRMGLPGSFVEDGDALQWPVLPIRWRLLPEPASELIKALLGRAPDCIQFTLIHPRLTPQAWSFDLAEPPTHWSMEGGRLTGPFGEPGQLRKALRSVVASVEGSTAWSRADRSDWTLVLQPMWGHGTAAVVSQAPEQVAMGFERDLHPLLEEVLSHARRDDAGGPLLEVDRRPVPTLRAQTLGEFLSVTGAAADPWGWSALDRLGLGVTVRLFDTVADRFLAPEQLHRRIRAGVEAARAVCSDLGRFLFVEYLLKPGAMTRRTGFERLADRTGSFVSDPADADWQDDALAMVRISMRPLLHKALPETGWPAFWHNWCVAMNVADESEKNPDFANRDAWLQWSRHFLDLASDRRDVLPAFALGAVEQTEPVQVAADALGRLRVNLAQADGYAHRLAFAVLPQWRYANLLRDCGVLDETPAVLAEDLCQVIATSAQAVATLERTAPLLPQAVQVLGRLGDTEWGQRGEAFIPWPADKQTRAKLLAKGYRRAGSIPGTHMAFLLPQHAEQVLDEDNPALARSLSQTGVLWQLGLHTVDHRWAGEYQDETPGATDPGAFADDQELLARLATRQWPGDAPARSRVRVVRNLPHWYRHTLQASVAAGTAVAQVTAAYLPEAHASLVGIENGKQRLGDGHPWRVPGSDSLLTPTMQLDGESLHYAHYRLSLPALRYRDTTTADTLALWNDTVAQLPDPQVIYDLELHTPGSELRPQRTVTALARIFRGSGEGRVLQVLGIAPDWDVQCLLEPDDDASNWSLTICLSPLSRALAVPPQVKDALRGSPLLRGEQLRVAGGWSAAWLGQLLEGFEPAQRLDLGAELWSALKSVIEPAAEGLEDQAAFTRFGLWQLRLVRPDLAEQRAEQVSLLKRWLNRLRRSGNPLGGALAQVIAKHLDETLKDAENWPLQPYRLQLPWTTDLPVPGHDGWLEKSWSLPLVPELSSPAWYAGAKKRNPSLRAALDRRQQAQHQRLWSVETLVIRASRGDAIALELPAIKVQP